MKLTYAAVLALVTSVVVAAPARAATDAELAAHWAPVHHQDTDSSDYDADYLSTVDFDGDWNAKNNWESQDDSLARLTGAAYYSVVETSTHWFVVYAYYHPRDWDDSPDPLGQRTHENDLEGVLLTVRRDGSAFGKLEAAVTVAHSDFYSYVPAGSPYVGGQENVDGVLRLVNGRPATRQEAKGHGLYAWDGKEFPGGDGVVYVPGAAEVPSSGNDRSVGYRLVNVLGSGGMWARRNNAETFASFGTFLGDNGKDNAAHAPWGWDDQNDGSILRGFMATDPARLVNTYFAGKGNFSLTYTRNAYR